MTAPFRPTAVLAVLALAVVMPALAVGVPTGQSQAPLQPRFQAVASADAASAASASTVRAAGAAAGMAGAAAAANAGAGAGAKAGAAESGRDDARAGGEWWLKDPPWFLPPPPEWGPMPPTMYTSFFHKPRYPALSTANYYPLYSREDEYDAHLPASMSRRAAHTQQQLYDHYVATYRDHMNGGPNAPLPMGDPNTGVRNPALMGHLGTDAGRAMAHMDAMQVQHPNNYFPGFSAMAHGAPAFVNGGAGGYGAAMALGGAFVEVGSSAGDGQHRVVTHFAASATPRFLQTAEQSTDEDEAEDTDAEAEAETDESADAEEVDAEDADAEDAEDAEDADSVETEVSDAADADDESADAADDA